MAVQETTRFRCGRYLYSGSANLGVDTIVDNTSNNGSAPGLQRVLCCRHRNLTSATQTVNSNLGLIFGGRAAQPNKIIGTAYNDTLTGSVQVNSITGGDGNDVLSGGDGNDVLVGGLGNDVLSGALAMIHSSGALAMTLSPAGMAMTLIRLAAERTRERMQ